jgi:hypothetical protein
MEDAFAHHVWATLDDIVADLTAIASPITTS